MWVGGFSISSLFVSILPSGSKGDGTRGNGKGTTACQLHDLEAEIMKPEWALKKAGSEAVSTILWTW